MREEHSTTITGRRIVLTLCLAITLGFIVGLLHPRQHVAVEQGQVLAGVVEYDHTNPWYIYQAKAWNASAQLSALGLRLGIPAVSMSLIMSGIVGALFMASVALLSLAVTNRITVSILVPFIILTVSKDGIFGYGYGYPMMLLNTQHTYGMIGLSYMVLTLSFFALKRERVGLCLLGLSIMMHASLSVWFHVAFLIYILLDIRHIRQWIWKGLPALGCYALSLSSLLWQRLVFTYPPLPLELHAQYLDVIIEHWSFHSHYILEFNTVEGTNLIVTILCCLFLLIRSRHLAYSYRFLSRIILIMIAVGLVGYILTRVPFSLADTINILLPNRLLNIPFFVFVSVAISTCLSFILQRIEGHLKKSQPRTPFDLLFVLKTVTLTSTIAIIALIIGFHSLIFSARYEASFGFLDSPVFVEARQTDGLLLVAPVYVMTSEIQLATSRPLVMSPLADGYLPYAIEAGPITATLLEKIYHYDFFNPSDRLGSSKAQIFQVWEDRTTGEWIDLAEEFGFTQILMTPDTPLQLPIAAHDDPHYTLYDIPEWKT